MIAQNTHGTKNKHRGLRFSMSHNKSKDPFFPIIDGMVVDAVSLLSIQHNCIPTKCSISNMCCTHYDVYVNDAEIDHIVGLIPNASRYARKLAGEAAFNNIFEHGENETCSIDKDENNRCVFIYKSKANGYRCSLHQVSCDLGLSIKLAKPFDCILWPLAIYEDDQQILTVQDNCFKFPCNKHRQYASPMLDKGIAGILKDSFGYSFSRNLQTTLCRIHNEFEEDWHTGINLNY